MSPSDPPLFFFLWHPSAPLLLTAAGAEHLPATAVQAAAAPPPAAALPTRRLDVGRRPRPPLLSYFARATTTRASAGLHIAAAVDSPLHNPKALSFACISTTRAPANHSLGSPVVSPTPDLRSPPPPRSFLPVSSWPPWTANVDHPLPPPTP
jgi:hypothetical protein